MGNLALRVPDMHKPGDEKRAVVILRPVDWEERLRALNVKALPLDAAVVSGTVMAAEPANLLS